MSSRCVAIREDLVWIIQNCQESDTCSVVHHSAPCHVPTPPFLHINSYHLCKLIFLSVFLSMHYVYSSDVFMFNNVKAIIALIKTSNLIKMDSAHLRFQFWVYLAMNYVQQCASKCSFSVSLTLQALALWWCCIIIVMYGTGHNSATVIQLANTAS